MNQDVFSILRGPVRVVRRHLSGRQVIKINPMVRGGNCLYFWQEMFLRDQRGARAVVTKTPAMDAWLDEFPLLRPLTIDEQEMTWLDQQLFMYPRRPGVDFSRAENERFCRGLVSSSPMFRARRARLAEQVTDATCVVNVRRGDYYSVPEYRARFSLDIRRHVGLAVDMARAAGRPIDDIILISDDVAWCTENLMEAVGEFRVVEDRDGMFDDLAALSLARTLVLANSTFSYWGSFLAESHNSDTLVIAPPFHERDENGALLEREFAPHWRRTAAETIG